MLIGSEKSWSKLSACLYIYTYTYTYTNTHIVNLQLNQAKHHHHHDHVILPLMCVLSAVVSYVPDLIIQYSEVVVRHILIAMMMMHPR